MKRHKILWIVLIVLVGAATIALGAIMLQSTNEEAPDVRSAEPAAELTQHEQTAVEAATIMTTWNPASDYNRTAAEDRASHPMTDERASKITPPERPARGQEWIEAAQHEATSKPTVAINYFTETDENTVSVFATWEWIADSGETLPSDSEERIYYFSFNEVGEIHDYSYETIRQRQAPENEN